MFTKAIHLSWINLLLSLALVSVKLEHVYGDPHSLFSRSAISDAQKRHIGSALNVRYGTWRFGSPNRGGDTKRMDVSKMFQGLHQGAYQKRGLGSALRWRNRVMNSGVDAKRFPLEYNLDVLDAGPEGSFTQAIKRGLGAALQSRYRGQIHNGMSDKRGLGSAMQSSWRKQQNQIESLLRNRIKRSIPQKKGSVEQAFHPDNNELSLDDVLEHRKSEDKRHLGAALRNWNRRPKKEDGNVGDVGLEAGHVDKKDVGDNTAEQNKDKRHLGSALNVRKQSYSYLNSGSKSVKRSDESQEENLKAKRHLGSALRAGKHSYSYLNYKKKDEKRTEEAQVAEKRHLGSALRMRKPHFSRVNYRSNDAKRNEMDDAEKVEEKRHLGAALRMRKPGHSRVNYRSGDAKRSETSEEEKFEEKRHLGAALRMGKPGYSRVNYRSGNAKRSETSEEDKLEEKRHLGAALRMREPGYSKVNYRSSNAKKSEIPAEEKLEEKRHLGSALRMQKPMYLKNELNVDKRTNEEPPEEEISGDKRHIGAALRMKFMPSTEQKKVDIVPVTENTHTKYAAELDLTELNNGTSGAVHSKSPYDVDAFDTNNQSIMETYSEPQVNLASNTVQKRHLSSVMKSRQPPFPMTKFSPSHYLKLSRQNDVYNRIRNNRVLYRQGGMTPENDKMYRKRLFKFYG